METLIFLLVIIFITIINIARIQKKTRAQGKESGHEGGWKKNLRDLLSEMQGETQPPREKVQDRTSGRKRSKGWEDLLASEDIPEKEPEPVSSEDQPPVSRQREPGPAERNRTLIESRSRDGLTPEARVGKTEKRAPSPPIYEPAAEGQKQARSVRISREELRRAVVWYEVLGPPVSLRDPEREMWL